LHSEIRILPSPSHRYISFVSPGERRKRRRRRKRKKTD
jgi:hypothetical protein